MKKSPENTTNGTTSAQNTLDMNHVYSVVSKFVGPFVDQNRDTVEVLTERWNLQKSYNNKEINKRIRQARRNLQKQDKVDMRRSTQQMKAFFESDIF